MRKFVFLIFITFSSVLHAQDSLKKDIANAASIENSIKRLAAFDAVAKKYYLAPGTKTKQETGGKWNIIVDTSPLDDLQTVTAVLASDSPVNKDKYASLILRYKEGQFDTFITSAGLYLGTDSRNQFSGGFDVTTRFGKERAQETKWLLSTDGKAVFYTGKQEHFITKLENVDSLLVRLTPVSENPKTFSFSTTGIKKVKESIIKAVNNNIRLKSKDHE